MADYDLAIIGGGLNGVCIARDAAGRGLRVILLEQGDLGSAASSASPRLIHGDLALLEQRALLRVRAALAERDTLLRIAPHLVRPMRFAIPAHSDERPLWLLRAGLWLYDRFSSRGGLPPSTTVDITHHPIGNALKRPFGTAFEYSDCVADDTRLVIDNDGWEHTEVTDLFAIHDYTRTGKEFQLRFQNITQGLPLPMFGKLYSAPGHKYNGSPILLWEFGGVGYVLPEDKTIAPENSWGYSGLEADPDSALERIRGLYEAIARLPQIAGICYTQLYDVEQEVNGLMTYDRRMKFDPRAIRAINSLLI